jgi:hypothetical protein
MRTSSLVALLSGLACACGQPAGTLDAGLGEHTLACEAHPIFCGIDATDAGGLPNQVQVTAQCDFIGPGLVLTLQQTGALTRGDQVVGFVCGASGDTGTLIYGSIRQSCRLFTDLVWDPGTGRGNADAGAIIAGPCP